MQVEALFEDIDRAWRLASQEKVHLRIFGAAALLLQTDYARGTKDSDILETMSVTSEVKAHLLEIAGSGTVVAKRHRLFVEIVSSGLPFLR